MIDKDKLYTLNETAGFMKISSQSVLRRINDKEIPYTNIGNDSRKIYRIEGSNILNYLNK